MNSQPSEQAKQQQNSSTILNRMFVSIFLVNMAMTLGQNMSNTLLSVYANSLGATAASIGILMSTFAISAIFFRLISAVFMDTYNRKYIVIFAAVILSISFFGFGISTSVPSLMGFRLLQGCGMAFGNACCLAMVAEILPKDKYGAGIGYYSLAQVISQAIGPSFGLWLAGLIGYNKTYAITGCIMLLAAFLASQIKNNFKRTKKLIIVLDNIIAKEALLPAAILFLLSIGFCIINSFLIIFADKQGVTTNIGLYFTVTAVTMLFTRPVVGRLTDRYGLVKVLVPALLCNVLAFLIISSSHTLMAFLLAAFISAFGIGACQPALQTLSMKTVTNDRRGTASSTNFIGMDLGFLLGPTIAGSIAQNFGYVIMWRVMVIPFFIAILLVLFFRYRITHIEKVFMES